MAKGSIGDADVAAFNRDGFVLVRGMLDPEETGLLGRAAQEDRVLDEHSFGRADGEGGTVRLSLWNHPADDHLRHVRALRVASSARWKSSSAARSTTITRR